MLKTQWHILQLSDTHFLEDPSDKLYDLNTTDTFLQVINSIKSSEIKPDCILLTGDLSNDGSQSSYKRLASIIDEFKIPTFYLPGNHDVQPNIHDYLPSQFISNQPFIELGNWRILLLDSTVPDETPGYLSHSQLQWLEESLLATKKHPVIIGLHHHLLFDERFQNTYEVTNSAEFFKIIDEFQHIKAVVYGHVHQVIEINRNNVNYLSCPSTAAQFKWDLTAKKIEIDKNLSPGFRWLTLENDGRLISEIRWVS